METSRTTGSSRFMTDQPPLPVNARSVHHETFNGVALAIPAAEFMLLVHAAGVGAQIGAVVLGDGDSEAEQLVVIGLARSGYEAWTILATGRVPALLNVAGRDPSHLIALAIPPDSLPGPIDLVEIAVRVTAFDPSIPDPEATVPGWYLCTPDLDLRRWYCDELATAPAARTVTPISRAGSCS